MYWTGHGPENNVDLQPGSVLRTTPIGSPGGLGSRALRMMTMKPSIVAGGPALLVTVMCVAFGVAGADAPKGAERAACVACLEVCRVPLSYDDTLLEESTDSYTPAAPREIATTAAIAMAAKLKSIHREYTAGHFGRAYEAHAGEIEGLTAKQAPEHATSAEIAALKRVRTALYADAVVALQADATSGRSQKLAAAYRARAAVLDGVLQSMSAPQQMRAAERLAVCEVLSAYKDEQTVGAEAR
jgi:hypothetical protein